MFRSPMFRLGFLAFCFALPGSSFAVSPTTASFPFGAPQAAGQTVLLNFTLPGCGACRQIDPLLKEMSERGYPIRNVDGATQRELVQRFQVTQFPTFVMLADGTVVDRVVGGGDPTMMGPRIRKMFEEAQKHLLANNTIVPGMASRGVPTTVSAIDQPTSSATHPVTRQPVPADASAGTGTAMLPLQVATPRLQPIVQPAATLMEQPAALSSHLPIPQGVTTQNDPAVCDSSVRLRINHGSGHSWGTGTIIDAQAGYALVLTCGHLFRESQGKGNIEVNLFASAAEYTVPGKCLHYDLETDLGLVVVTPLCPVRVSPLIRDESSLPVGTTVVSVGCDGGAKPTVREHSIKSFDRIGTPRTNAYPFHYIQVSGAPVGGRSGGGLFTKDGYLLGVCNTADPEPDEGHFVPPHVIRHVLDSRGLANVHRSPSLSDPTRQLSTQPDRVAGISALEAPVGSTIAADRSTLRADRFDHLPVLLPTAASPNGTGDTGENTLPGRDSQSAGTVPNASLASLASFATPVTASSVPVPKAPFTSAGYAIPVDSSGNAQAKQVGNHSALHEAEQATLDEIARRRQDGDEVILIVRSRRDPESSTEVIRLGNVSERFLSELAKTPSASPARTDTVPTASPIPVAHSVTHVPGL